MNNELTISEAVKEILVTPVPLLLMDTCSLLDIIRQPFRDGIPLDTIKAAMRLTKRSNSKPKHLWIVILSIVKNEMNDHIFSVSNELVDFINKTDNSIIKLNAAFSIIGQFKPIPLYQNQHLCLHDELVKISNSLLDEVLILIEGDPCKLRGLDRVCSNTPPARKGSQAKDCVIIEHYFELCRKLRDSGFNMPCVFTSSNTNDYLENGALKHPLESEFKSLDLIYTKDLAWAETKLK